MLTREQLDQLLDHRAGGAVAGIPSDAIGAAGIARDQPADVEVLDLGVADRAGAVLPVALGRHPADRLDVLAEKRTVLEHHLEAVVIGGIMAAGYLYAAVHL